MRKKITVIIIFILISSFGLVYLNNVFLPKKLKSLLINSLQKETGKQIGLESLSFNIFKGLVLRNLKVYDDKDSLLSLKEAFCTFLIWPVFKKNIIIPTLTVSSPEVFLERNKDNTLNLQEIFLKKNPPKEKKNGFNVIIYKLKVKNANILFRDNAFSPPFEKKIEKLDLLVNFSLPSSLKFKLKAIVNASYPVELEASGQYSLPQKKLEANIGFQNLFPKDFAVYYQTSNIVITEGIINGLIKLEHKPDLLQARLNTQNRSIIFSRKNALGKFNGNVEAEIRYGFKEKAFQVLGKADISDSEFSRLRSDGKSAFLLSEINGQLDFSQNGLNWKDLKFNYVNTLYKTSGTLADFNKPRIDLRLLAKDIVILAGLEIKQKSISITKSSGQYLNSGFEASGEIDLADPATAMAGIKGMLDIELSDLKTFPLRFKDSLAKASLSGRARVEFDYKGPINDIKSATINAKLSSDLLSVKGLKFEKASLNYDQENGIAGISSLSALFYDGKLEAGAGMNLSSDNLPFWITASGDGIKLEKLKLDTQGKDKEMAGTIKASVKVNGYSNDLSKLSGAGDVLIKDGKLWELNLFRGLGSFLFAKDFANIVFTKGACNFIIKDKYILTDDLKLESAITNLSGPLKIGFDNSVSASISVNVLDDLVPLSGTFRDVATAIIGKAGRFGVIRISGTLKEPKYSFAPLAAIMDVLKGLKETFLGK